MDQKNLKPHVTQNSAHRVSIMFLIPSNSRTKLYSSILLEILYSLNFH